MFGKIQAKHIGGEMGEEQSPKAIKKTLFLTNLLHPLPFGFGLLASYFLKGEVDIRTALPIIAVSYILLGVGFLLSDWKRKKKRENRG